MYTSVTVCVHRRMGRPSCGAGRGDEIADALTQALADMGAPLSVARIYCFGLCDQGPTARLTPGGPFFHGLNPDNLSAILDEIRKTVGAHAQTDAGLSSMQSGFPVQTPNAQHQE